ncbi:hypothetical protein BJX61DRAFT_545803 [Aspergillus egyptiacus]|nr:hypothetical protein BJX61DRAFT_545803 [Aspergillus egyptiacus]
MSTPLPNPPFVFPARDPDDAHDQDAQLTPKGRPALPAFSFNPGSTTTNQASVSTPSPNRASGHRRQYSEFVGSERLVAPGNVTSGQTNDDGLTMPMKLPPPGPGFSASNRRRHAHRRSAAISSVDLTAISNALDVKSYPGSAPCAPAIKRENMTPNEPHQSSPWATSLESPQIIIDAATSGFQSQADPRPSDPVPSNEDSCPAHETEVASRPVTPAIKSETSISFLRDESSPGLNKSRPRPRTADASLMLEPNGNGLPDDCSPDKRPLSATGHSRSHKSMSAGLLNTTFKKSHVEDENPSPSSSRKSSNDDGSDYSTDGINETSGSPSSASKKKLKAKKRRQQKVRSWAGALLVRGKSKRHSEKGNSREGNPGGIAPPMLTRTNSDYGAGLDVEFDDDNIVVIRTPTNPTHPETNQAPSEDDSWTSLENAWKPKSFYEQTTLNDSMGPVIDLDAALGPFNTPDMRSGRPAETGFSAATRRMYSGGRRGEFIGPEMRYHRRAESAPVMPPFDRAFLGGRRLPTASTMENPDVFYEEEEDAFLAATSESGKESQENLQDKATLTQCKDDKSEHSGGSSDTLTGKTTDDCVTVEHTGPAGRTTEASEATPVPAMASSTPQEDFKQAESQPESVSPFSVHSSAQMRSAGNESWRNRTPVPPSPDISPRFLPVDYRPPSSPMELPPALPPFSFQGACSPLTPTFPSPDFTVSSETPRSITTSSTTEPYSHASIEDVPSLTSSASTMTNTLNRLSATFFSRPRLSTDRSASFSAAVHRRSSQASSKRASLASLSKLVVGPHTEKSKLSHEEKPPSDEPESTKRKGHRISRLVHFWRVKDKEKLNEPAVQE